jgi:two-component system, OmpR family, response regulator
MPAPLRVLYVDDDRINALLFAETCRFAGGIEIETAASGSEALERVASWVPELLVLDLHLPDTTGYALLPQLRQALGQPLLPAMLCSAEEPSRVEAAAKQAGFNGCWSKPVHVQSLLDQLAEHAARRATPP